MAPLSLLFIFINAIINNAYLKIEEASITEHAFIAARVFVDRPCSNYKNVGNVLSSKLDASRYGARRNATFPRIVFELHRDHRTKASVAFHTHEALESLVRMRQHFSVRCPLTQSFHFTGEQCSVSTTNYSTFDV